MSEFATWPEPERRDPPRSLPTWAVRAPLSAWLREEARRAGSLERRRVLDVGCGSKPYYPFFAAVTEAYVGVDVQNPAADLEGSAEAIPVEDGSFDVVLCTQVLEHSDDPAAVVRELRRVTAPGGRVLASTHGVQVYHPNPDDFWRWTHAGLEKLFRDNGAWAAVSVTPASGTAACVGMLLNVYATLVLERLRLRPVARAFCSLVNSGAAVLDERSPKLRGPARGSLHANYHVVAEVAQ